MEELLERFRKEKSPSTKQEMKEEMAHKVKQLKLYGPEQMIMNEKKQRDKHDGHTHGNAAYGSDEEELYE